jgi:hypothetical protein
MSRNLMGYAAIATYLAHQYPTRSEINKRAELFQGKYV